ncbi:MAG: LptF/LptG family permease [Verrucomicrobiota bacterium]
MRLLDRYLLRELLLPLGYCLGGFLIFWISFDLINQVSQFQKSGLSVKEVAEFYFITSPELLLVVMPVALLLALLYALTTHARYNEFTAMRAAGVSLWRLSAPYFGVGMIFCVAYLALNELAVPTSVEKSEEILHRHDSGRAPGNDLNWRRDLKFRNARDNRDWWIKSYNLKSSEMQNVVIDWHFSDGTRTVFFAQKGFFFEGIWRFQNVKQLKYSSRDDITSTAIATNELEFSGWAETPALIKSEIKISSLNSRQAVKRPQLSIADILNYMHLHPRLDRTTASLVNTQLHGRIAAPVTCLVVVLIALPFGATSGRRNVFVGVASSIFICFSYFILLRLGLALGTGGWLPGWLAAWLPNILFGGVAIWMTMRVQ